MQNIPILNRTKSDIIKSCSNSSVKWDSTSSELDTLVVIYLISIQLRNVRCQNAIPSLYCNNNEEFMCIDNEMCSVIRDTNCAIEWRLAENVFNFSKPLSRCCNNHSNQLAETTPSLSCTDEFVLTCDSICMISCEDFSQYTESATKSYFRVFIFSGNSLMVGAFIVIFLSIIKRKTM